jgi:hypothetical protein
MTWPVAFLGIEDVLLWAMREMDKLSLPHPEFCAPLAGDVALEVSISVDDPVLAKAAATRGLSAT